MSVSSPAPIVLRITHDGDATDLSLDPATWLPVKSAGISLTNPDRPVQIIARREHPAAQERHAHRREVPGTHGVHFRTLNRANPYAIM
jgi:hypothetical protein